MCDYSLHAVASRPASVGDRLVTTEFAYTCTRAFADMEDRATAVCLLPGTEIAFDKEVDRGFVSRLLGRPAVGRVARFRRINEEHEIAHHDALEFADGTILLVTNLRRGLRATVLQLPSAKVGNAQGEDHDALPQVQAPAAGIQPSRPRANV